MTRGVCISRKSAASSSSDGWQPRTSARTCKSARQRSSIDIQFLRSANKSLSHVHVHLLLFLLLSWPGASDPAPYSCHPYPLYRLPILPTHARARTHTHTHTAKPSTGSLIEDGKEKNIGGSAKPATKPFFVETYYQPRSVGGGGVGNGGGGAQAPWMPLSRVTD